MFSDEMAMPDIIGNILSDEINSNHKILLTEENSQQEAEYYEPNLIIITSWHRANLIPIFKAYEKTKNIPVILLSGALSQEEGESYFPDAFLSKPVDIKIFLSTVKDILFK